MTQLPLWWGLSLSWAHYYRRIYSKGRALYLTLIKTLKLSAVQIKLSDKSTGLNAIMLNSRLLCQGWSTILILFDGDLQSLLWQSLPQRI